MMARCGEQPRGRRHLVCGKPEQLAGSTCATERAHRLRRNWLQRNFRPAQLAAGPPPAGSWGGSQPAWASTQSSGLTHSGLFSTDLRSRGASSAEDVGVSRRCCCCCCCRTCAGRRRERGRRG